MKLTVHERLTLLGILPEESSYAGVREITRLHSLLGLNDEESEKIEVVRVEGTNQIGWNHEKALGLIVDVPMGEWITEVIRLKLRDMDRAQELRPEQMSLFEKFIFDYE